MSVSGKIRVLIADDSAFMRKVLHSILSADPGFEVAGEARDGREAVSQSEALKPDVITMDIHMPKVDGFEATRRIMETCPTPIVIVSGSSSADEVANNFHAIDAGALAVIPRPTGIGHPDHESTARELLETVRLMSEVKVIRRWPRVRLASAVAGIPSVEARRPHGKIQVVAIGASTGGPIALQTILSRLPKDFAVPILIVQHMAAGFVHGFTEWLAHSSGFPVQVAADGERLLSGHAYVAPDEFHMGVRMGNHIHLAQGGKENGMQPAVSYLFRSVREVFGSNIVAVLLTGMGTDGAEELKRLKDAGAMTIAQDKESSIVHGMPGQAILIGAAAHVLPPESIALTLATIATRA